jgi:hypothetical protein
MDIYLAVVLAFIAGMGYIRLMDYLWNKWVNK